MARREKYSETFREACREVVTKERLYERLNNDIRQSEISIVREQARLDALKRFRWVLDEYFEDLEITNKAEG